MAINFKDSGDKTRKSRGGEKLTKEQVKEIKVGRKELRKTMKKSKIFSKSNFETIASSRGLYFDAAQGVGALLGLSGGGAVGSFIKGHALAVALATTVAGVGGTYALSYVNETSEVVNKFVDKIVEVIVETPVEVIKEILVPEYVEVEVEVPRYVEVEVEVPYEVEVEIPYEVEVEVEVEVPDPYEVEVPEPYEVEVEVDVEVPVEVPLEVIEYTSSNTINVEEELGELGISLSTSSLFDGEATTQLVYGENAHDMGFASFSEIPENIDEIAVGGVGTGVDVGYPFFSYTFYLQNSGTQDVSYEWSINKTAETAVSESGIQVSDVSWFMIFENGQMWFFAKGNDNGKAEMLPSYVEGEDDDPDVGPTSAYPYLDIISVAADTDQFQELDDSGNYHRIIPYDFTGTEETVMGYGEVEDLEVSEVVKYTIVMWLEGDDPDATSESISNIIGGTMGFTMDFKLSDEEIHYVDDSSLEDIS